MRLNRRLLVNLVAVLMLGIVTVGWLVTQLVGSGGLSRPFTVTADFRSSGGVFTNQEVTYRGVLVGKVGSLSLNDNNGVDIQLEISPEWRGKIPSDVVASVQSKSAVGEQFVNLTPLSSSGPRLTDGSVIPRDHTKLPVDFQSLLRSIDAVLGNVDPARARDLIKALSTGVAHRGDDIATILRSLGTLASSFARSAPHTKSLLSNATQAGAAFLRTKDEFAAAMRSADKVATAVGEIPQSLKHFFAANNRLAITGSALLAQHGTQLAGGIKALADFTDYQLAHRNALEDSLKFVPQFLHAVEDSSIPWQSPDGRRFYRIRTGLVLENERSSWPCKYKLPLHYERYPHVRDARRTITTGECLPSTAESDADEAVALVTALQAWSDRHAAFSTPGRSSSAKAGGVAFMWPLDGPITSYFGPRDGGFHPGIDIDGETGDPVLAAASGRVAYAGTINGYGNAVIINHGHGLATLYGHLSRIDVHDGQRVTIGAVVGAVGCTGNCTGSHLHFEVRLNGVPVDPLPYLPGGRLWSPSVTGSPSPVPTPQPSSGSQPTPAPSPTRSKIPHRW